MNGLGKRDKRRRPLWTGFLQNSTPPLDASELSAFRGKRILITGAGGFLGSALARRLATTAAAELILLDQAEYGLYRLDQLFRKRRRQVPFSLVVGSINDRKLVRELFTRVRPDLVFHTAARKHVPLMESNAFAATETNVFGTLALVEAAQGVETRSFVLLSTDKAVAPVSVMGATKHIAEQIVLDARSQQSVNSDFKALRLCNVLGSTGSVAPLFARQIAGGGPITVTHSEATRHFLSVHDAVRHCLRTAVARTRTGLLIPASAPARHIQDLARFMLAQQLNRSSRVPMVYTGLRPADKLHECLTSPTEHTAPSPVPGMLEVCGPSGEAQLARWLPELTQSLRSRDHTRLFESIAHLVPDFKKSNLTLAAALAETT